MLEKIFGADQSNTLTFT